jgi:thiazole synthase
MPLASPIGSGLGLQNKINISLIVKQSKVPVIVDAGIGTASDATIAMELGCDGVLVNSAIANAKKPIIMAKAFKDAVISGRNSFNAGRMQKNYFASASSPTKGLI